MHGHMNIKNHDMSFNYPLEWSHEQIWLSSKIVQMKLPAKCPLNTSQQSVENVERWFTLWPPSNTWPLCQENLKKSNSLTADSATDSWDLPAPHKVVIPYRCFGTTYQSHHQGSRFLDSWRWNSLKLTCLPKTTLSSVKNIRSLWFKYTVLTQMQDDSKTTPLKKKHICQRKTYLSKSKAISKNKMSA